MEIGRCSEDCLGIVEGVHVRAVQAMGAFGGWIDSFLEGFEANAPVFAEYALYPLIWVLVVVDDVINLIYGHRSPDEITL